MELFEPCYLQWLFGVQELVRTDFCKDPIVPRPELRISSNKNLENLHLYVQNHTDISNTV